MEEVGMMSKKGMMGNKWTKLAIIVAVLLVVGAALYMMRSYFVAATVDGAPISRWSVMKEAEKQSGKAILDSMITQKLVEKALDEAKVTVSNDEINTELAKIEDQLKSSGMSLDDALKAQGITKEDLVKQIKTQKRAEKLLSDKLSVSDDEIKKYISDNKLTAPQGTSEADFKTQVADGLKGQKFSAAAADWVNTLQAKAKITRYVSY